MLEKKHAEEIIRALSALPADKIAEAQDFILFLQARYGQQGSVDESDVWAEEDLRDVSAAALNYVGELFPEKAQHDD
ncbi:MAG: DUF2281 domain-containing protein [Acidobacteriota bacterium]|nr:DUF2281 domain-containing protein [Acidobacteriota bacterium]